MFYTCTQLNFFLNGGHQLNIAIVEADLRYNNNINIVYNDTDDVVSD